MGTGYSEYSGYRVQWVQSTVGAGYSGYRELCVQWVQGTVSTVGIVGAVGAGYSAVGTQERHSLRESNQISYSSMNMYPSKIPQ